MIYATQSANEASRAGEPPGGKPPAGGPPGDSGHDFTILVKEHQGALLARAVKLCADRARAHDLVQDTFERALRRFVTFVPGTNGRAWLMTIMANLFIDQLRKGRVVVEVGISGHDGIIGELSAEELRATPQQLHEAIAALPDELRQVIELHELQGLAYRDIAQRLAIPMGTIGTRLARARTQLQAALHALVEEA